MIRAVPLHGVNLMLGLVGLTVAIATPDVAFAQAASAQTSQPARATLEVTVVDASTENALAYAVVAIAQIGAELYTDSRGRLVLPTIGPGTYRVQVRRLGFTPVSRTVTVTFGASATLQIRMVRIAQQLSRVRVTAAATCANPGVPDATREPEVFMLVSLLRENADRYRLLASQHPFVSVHTRVLGDLRDSALYVEQVDVQTLPSQTRVGYRPGRLVVRRENQYRMGLPTILDLADDGFARTHCFFYGGATSQTVASGEETWFRLDVRADDRLKVPDVHGSFYLDSATAQLRKMDLQLSRPDKLPRQLASVADVQVTTKFLEIADGLAVINSVCAITHLVPGNTKSDSTSKKRVPIELQQMISYNFSSPPPDVPARRQFEGQEWAASTYASRQAVWCEASP